MNYTEKCICGGTFRPEDGLEGLFCDTCGAFKEGHPLDKLKDLTICTSVEKSYTEDKLKAIRGIPVNRIIIGSESKGRVEISVPIFVSKEEQKFLIDQQLDLLEYAKSEIKRRDLDIMPKK